MKFVIWRFDPQYNFKNITSTHYVKLLRIRIDGEIELTESIGFRYVGSEVHLELAIVENL